MIVRHCDRCGAELYREPANRVQFGLVVDNEGRLIYELCEACSVELRRWAEEHS